MPRPKNSPGVGVKNNYELKKWEEVVGEVRKVEESKETLDVTIAIDSLLVLQLPKDKISGDVPRPGHWASIIRTDVEYRVSPCPDGSILTRDSPRVLVLKPNIDYKIIN
jgi:hypothetical protein